MEIKGSLLRLQSLALGRWRESTNGGVRCRPQFGGNTPSPLFIGALRSASRTLRGLACLLYIFVRLVVSILHQRIHAFDNGGSLR